MISTTVPGSRTTALAYDAAGDVSGVTPPGQPQHTLTYTNQSMIASYTAPESSAMTLAYDADDMLVGIDRPGAGDATLGYDSASRLQKLTDTGLGEDITYDYEGATSRQKRVTAPGETVETTFDGPLALKDTFSGDASGVLTRSYDDDLRISSTTLGQNTIFRSYDDDGLPTEVGDLTTTRGANGLITGTALDGVTSEQGYNEYGEPATNTFKAPDGNAFWVENLTHDHQGRITTETSGGHTTSYDRDASGRLISATRDGNAVTYGYDANGNLLSAGGVTGTYDGQDRLLTWGTTQYTYLASGERATKTAGADVTAYDWDARGDLRGVTLPDATKLTYTVDGLGRRVAVHRGTDVIARYVYGEALGPSAEVDQAGTVLTRYVYGSRPNVPEYMIRGGQTYRFVLDSRGSVRAVVDAATGEITQRLEYDAYGRVIEETGTKGFQPFGFAGGLWDRDTGLVHFGAREYDPEVGRFTVQGPDRLRQRRHEPLRLRRRRSGVVRRSVRPVHPAGDRRRGDRRRPGQRRAGGRALGARGLLARLGPRRGRAGVRLRLGRHTRGYRRDGGHRQPVARRRSRRGRGGDDLGGDVGRAVRPGVDRRRRRHRAAAGRVEDPAHAWPPAEPVAPARAGHVAHLRPELAADHRPERDRQRARQFGRAHRQPDRPPDARLSGKLLLELHLPLLP